MDAQSTVGGSNVHEHEVPRSFSSLSNVSVASTNDMGNIKVIARFRPLLNPKEAAAEKAVTVTSDTTVVVTAGQQSQQFTFDKVFDGKSTQQELFEYSIRPIVEDVLHGYNGTVLAYGQTGAGKSHTMMGSHGPERGAIPRMIELIFAEIESSADPSDYKVEVSYLEIYNEKVKDLIEPSNGNGDLRVHEAVSSGAGPSGASGFYVKGLTLVPATHTAQVLDVMAKGNANRSTAATNMNHMSSRSHSIFSVDVTQKCGLRGRLFLVDLAGSEKASKTGARGQLLEEAANINRSLSTLGMVINNLASRQQPGSHVSHIPYRDSKLTRILQESLGGSSRTSMIINCSPSVLHLHETVSSLRFGTRAKYVRNEVRVNLTAGASESAFMQALVSELRLWRNGERPPKDAWVELPRSKNQPQHETRPTSRPSSRCGFVSSSTTHTSLTQARAARPVPNSSLQAELDELKERYSLMERSSSEQLQLKNDELAQKQRELEIAQNEAQKAREALHEAELRVESHETGRRTANDALRRHNEKHLFQENKALAKKNQQLTRMFKIERQMVQNKVEQINDLKQQLADRNVAAQFDQAYVQETYLRLEPLVNDMVRASP